MSIYLTLFFLFIINLGFSQTIPAQEDATEVDSFTNRLEKLAREWDPESETWTFIEFRIEKLNITIKYGQKAIHPFLAEYERNIQFLTPSHQTDTLQMVVNTGGLTSIKLFHDPNENLLIMEDNFGQYFYDLKKNEYKEKLYKFEASESKKYLGIINGKEYPLKFEP